MIPRLTLFAILFLLLLGIFLPRVEWGKAAEAESCAAYLSEEGKKELDSFKAFLDQYFQFVEPTSTQVDEALERYFYYREAIFDLFEEASTIDTGKPFEDALKELNLCQDVRDEYLVFGDALLDAYVQGSSGSKTTFIIVDALKLINERMREELYLDFHLIFPSIFVKFDHLFPCYASQCITSDPSF